mgnify:CR=1 FL=1
MTTNNQADPREAIRSNIDYVQAHIDAYHEVTRTEGADPLTDDQWTDVQSGIDYIAEQHVALARYDRLADAAGQTVDPARGDYTPPTGVNVNRAQDPYDLNTLGFTATRVELVARARTAVDVTRNLDDDAKQSATQLMERHDTPRGDLARHLLGTGNDAYRTGWQKLVAGAGNLMADAERTAVEASRALSLTDAAGGFAVPFTLDPTIISTRSLTTNPVRRIASVRTTVTNEWNGVTSAGMTVSWDGEAAQVSDDSPTLAQPNIPVHKAQGFALGSIEISGDWANIESDLNNMFTEGKDDAEAIAFTTGTGSNQPTGIITALDGSASEIAPATAATFALADGYEVAPELPAKYRLATMDGSVQSSRASWLAARGTYNTVRQFDTGGGAALWETLGGGLPPRLLGHPSYEASAMDSAAAINAGATADNFVLLLGDFRYYLVVDRVGMSVEHIPHIMGANQRPTGQRGWYCYWRVGADSVNDDAFRLMSIPTTA